MDLTVGVITSAHGLRGDVMIEVRTDDPDARFQPGASLRTEPAANGPLTIKQVRVHKGRLMVSFVGVTDRTQAEALRGTALVIDATETETETDAWYPHQLRGLLAVDTAGHPYGKVSDLLPGAAQDLLVVDTGSENVLVPFVTEIVPTVDLEEGRVVLTPPGGLFPKED